MIEDLKHRYATKRFNDEKITEDKLNKIKEAILFAPSSYGAQPFTILHINDKPTLEKIKSLSFNQKQIIECSDLFLFCANDNFTENSVEEYINLISKTREHSLDSLNGFKKTLNDFAKKTYGDKLFWAKKQCYIALGFGLFAAALEKIDTCPMEGFESEKIDELLNLKGLKSTVILTLGYRAETDKYANEKKVRKPIDVLFQEFKL